MANELQTKLDAILLDKNTNLLPENLKSGVNCLGVNGTLTQGEDLQEQLDAQDLIIQQLQEELAGKASGGEVKPNIFMQETEPTTKDGIWLKSNKIFDKIYFGEKIYKVISETWDTKHSYSDIPFDFYYGPAVAIGTNIYIFGGESVPTSAYKYDTLTDTYTQLTNIPEELQGGTAAIVENYIYLFGCGSSQKNVYKYDTLTDTYTKLSSTSYSNQRSSAVSIGTNIYIFGSTNYSYNKCLYKYDTLTDSYTQLTNIPHSFEAGSVVAIGTNIYIFGGVNGSTSAYKYDTLTDTYTQLTNIPDNFYCGSAISIGTDIYLFGGGNSYQNTYKYDILTDTYTKLSDIPYQFYFGSATIAGNKAYLFGGSSYKNKLQVFIADVANFYDYKDQSIVIWEGSGNYRVQLYTNKNIEGKVLFPFFNVWYHTTENGLDDTIPTYYGNGTEWIKFKN